MCVLCVCVCVLCVCSVCVISQRIQIELKEFTKVHHQQAMLDIQTSFLFFAVAKHIIIIIIQENNITYNRQ